MESLHRCIIPGLSDDLALRCLAKLSHGYHGLLETVSKTWRDLLRSSDYANYKARKGWCGDWLFVLTEGSYNEWVAYDPEADRWHPLPKIPTAHGDWKHFGFSGIAVCNRFFVIGGSYAQNDPPVPHQKSLVTNEVMQFDPFKKQWTSVASMLTPRTHFACSVVSGKIYVVGGRNVSCTRGLALAEVYDPVANKWEELPPMLNPQMDCLGLSCKGRFHVLSDQVGLPDQNTSEVFTPSDGTWRTVEDIWPFSRAMQFAAQVIGDNRIYTVVDWGESLIKTRDTEKGEWYTVGSVPSVIFHDHPRPLEAFGYGFAALRHELYVLGGKALKWEQSGAGRFDIVKLGLVRVCNPSAKPLKWRETRPMIGSARGTVIGCASMEEESSFLTR
ncbi:F-box/kelch-repeat protein At1g16250 [Pyrus x bretschneideri]|uniref:F-box/kelch-repeat protein At1g16250 n=1 Tax=Pyrus x bretschneideri TaxID=225117 RepID=UPI00202E783C|nr:F-box/kelch-repeat protein At1g16250 [Pyrus x bretschneideri]